MMLALADFLVAVGVATACALAFMVIDQWHQRRAWRQAHEEALRRGRRRHPPAKEPK